MPRLCFIVVIGFITAVGLAVAWVADRAVDADIYLRDVLRRMKGDRP